MDIFNYLMNKKGKNLFDNEKMLSYLLGKNSLHELSGTEIEINKGQSIKIQELKMTKLSTQTGTPTPTNPVEVKTVKGYRNLFDVTEFENQLVTGKILNDNGVEVNDATSTYSKYMIPVKANTTYYRKGAWQRMYVYDTNKNLITRGSGVTGFDSSFTVEQDGYIGFQINNLYWSSNKGEEQITESNTELPYVPYGTNWVYTTISDGTNSKDVTIPLNDNEIAGIGTYLDELIIDKNGHCWLNKKTGKVVYDGSNDENWVKSSNTNVDRYVINSNLYLTNANSLCNCFSYGGITNYTVGKWNNNVSVQMLFNFAEAGTTTLQDWKNWLSTHNLIVYQPLSTEQLIDLNYNVDLTLYSGTNTITNSENMDMNLIYHY